jgi:pilus assembly protein FimV
VNKPDKSSIFKTSLLVALVGTAFGAQAAGLGKLVVYSAIGQPLNAEVALIATPEELTGLSARLAPHSAFNEAGVEFASALNGLRFNVAKAPDGQPVLRLTTDAPMNEPFLHFLVELSWTAGRMVREYTFLLDPPEMLKAAKPASVVVPAAPAMAMPADAQPAPVKSTPPVAVPAASVVRAKPAAAPAVDGVRVNPGDTLSKIAREYKPETVSLDQMLVALFNGNRDAFIGDNMNRLRAGKILRVPDPVEVAQVDAGAARKLIVSQAADFNAYRRRLAEATAAAPVSEVVSSQEAAGKIRPEVESAAPPPVTKDKLEVSRTETAKSASDGAGKSGVEEDLIARDKALREAAERIAHLEKNLENLKALVELKSQAGTEMQQQAQAVVPAKPAEETTQAAPVTAQPATAAPTAAESAGESAGEKPAEPVEQAKPAEAAPVPAKPAAKKPLAKKPAPPEPSFIEENPQLVFGGGGLVALLLGYLGYTAWRKKKQARDEADFYDRPSVSEGDQLAKSGVVRGAATEGLDNGEVSIQGDFSEGGVLTTEESVDPVAEADVLMAYGRDGQAEEILKEGLKADPTRGAIHLKLLELYANRKSEAEFESVAKELHGLSEGRGPDWEKATVLARELGLAGGLFPAEAPPPAVTPIVAEVTETRVPAEALEITEAPLPETVSPPRASETVVMESSPLTAQEDVLAADNGSLDFDLDLGTTSGPAVAAAQAETKPAAEEAMSLDFDFDLGAPEPSADIAVSPEPASASAPSDEAGGAIDFSLDVGEEAESVPALMVAVAEPAEAKAADHANAIDFSLDIGSLGELPEAQPESAAGPVSTAVAGGSLGDLGVDFDLELGATPPTETADKTSVAPALDLADISLDLGESSLPDVEVPVPVTPPLADIGLALDAGLPDVMPEEPVGLPEISLDGEPASTPEAAMTDFDDVPDDPEVATKLELALAYEEMGDREGARELLNEVLSEGSPAQQAQAQARLDQLDT